MRGAGCVGLGLSDISPEFRGSLTEVIRQPLSIVELQPELNTWSPRPLGQRYRFLSVHASSQGRDIASPDPEHRAFAIEETKRGMDFAQRIGADAFLTHAGHIYSPNNIAGIAEDSTYEYVEEHYWKHPEAREERRELFLASLAELRAFYEAQRYSFAVTIENLPFPNLGATMTECDHLLAQARQVWPVKLTIDVPHFWVSHLALGEHPELRPFVDGYYECTDDFYLDLKAFIARHDDDILYFHMSGVHDDKEHLPITCKRRYRPKELDLRRVAQIIGHTRPVILEVFNYPHRLAINSIRNFAALLRAA